MRVGSATDVGLVREGNEDVVAVGDGLWVAVDGMGGHEGGEIAAAAAAETLMEHAAAREGEDWAHTLPDSFGVAHERVAARGAETGMPDMGCVAVLARVGIPARASDPARTDAVEIAWVGDCRAYQLVDGALSRLTTDHNLAAELLAAGQLTEEQAHDHWGQSRLTRRLGGAEPAAVADTLTVPATGRLLLCTDGLTIGLRDPDLGRILGVGAPQSACAALVAAALEAGGTDNVSVIVVDLDG